MDEHVYQFRSANIHGHGGHDGPDYIPDPSMEGMCIQGLSASHRDRPHGIDRRCLRGDLRTSHQVLWADAGNQLACSMFGQVSFSRTNQPYSTQISRLRMELESLWGS
jgi:hypothetical protein